MHRSPALVSVSLLPLLAGCKTPSAADATPVYTLVRLETAARSATVPAAERAAAFGGHFENMTRLARDGSLVLSGPFGKQKSDPKLRGLFVIDTADRERARQLAQTDPAVVAGIFELSFATFATDAPLRAHTAADLAAYDAEIAAGRQPRPGDDCRNYVWLTADDGDAAAAVLASDPAALLIARLDGSRAMVLLDAQDLAAANALVAPLGARIGRYVLDEWFGSRRLAVRG